MAEECQNFDTARPRPSSVKIFFSNFDTAAAGPSSVNIFFSNFDTALLGRGMAVVAHTHARARVLAPFII